jgi:hypothetical protein
MSTITTKDGTQIYYTATHQDQVNRELLAFIKRDS